MTDFPTATELERFVFDQTGAVLNLKGRANKLKYQVAMDVLNGQPVDPKFIGSGNPYLDKMDMVPEEPMKDLPPRDPAIPHRDTLQNEFFTAFVPHSQIQSIMPKVSKCTAHSASTRMAASPTKCWVP
jgi:hypothetical protein